MGHKDAKEDLEFKLNDLCHHIATHGGISTSRLNQYIVDLTHGLLECWEQLNTHLIQHAVEVEYKVD